jgi:hypothetical protein
MGWTGGVCDVAYRSETCCVSELLERSKEYSYQDIGSCYCSHSFTMSSGTNSEDGFITFVIPGRPLTTNATPSELNSARNALTEQIRGIALFPLPADMALALEVVFKYPRGFNGPGAVEMTTIARELTIGILYEDNFSISSKSARKEVADDEGSTIVKIRPLAGDDHPI